MESICAKWLDAVCVIRIKSAEAMTAPRAREQAGPPSPPDRPPPRRGGGSSPSPCTCASAAGRAAGPARLFGARRGLVRSARALAAAALLALSGALALPAAAQAQEISLVSNIGQGHNTNLNINPPDFEQFGVEIGENRGAQRFTTGPNEAGYTLQSVVLNLHTNRGTGSVVQVAIHDNASSGNPGTLLAVLDNPADPIGNNTGTAGNRTFSAPNPLSLDADTHYWVMVSNTTTNNETNFDVSLTTSNNETTGHGFSIRDTRHQGTPGSWLEQSASKLRMEVRGTVVIPPGLEVTLHLSDDEPLEDLLAVTVTATASPATPVAFTVEISASPVAPATDDDFELSTNRTLSFAANATESTGTVRIDPVADEDPEPNDVVTVSGVVSNPAIPNPDDVRLTILNDDADLPQDIAIDAPAAVDEGAGTANVTVTLTTRQNTAPVIDAQLFYRQRPGTATRGDDYTRPQGLGNRIAIVPVSAFSANADGTAWVARHSFEIGIVDDGEAERDETIVFEIYDITDNRGIEQTIVIRDDDAIAPGTPTGLTAFPKSQTRIQLAWTAPEERGSFGITGYRIEASEDAGSSWNAVARTRGARTDFRHGGLSAGDTRHYRVSAVSGGGASAPSNVASATTVSAGPAATNPNLPPPTDVTAAPKLPGQIRLGWWTPLILGGQIDEYKYRRRAVDTSDWTNWNTVDASAGFHSRFVNNLDAGTTYEFQVRSVDRNDRYSETVSALATATGRPTISIARDTRSVEEGEPLRFTLSRGQPHAHGRLYVILQISETGDMLSLEGRRPNGLWTKGFYFGDGNATLPVVLDTVDDRGGPEPDSEVTVEVMPYPLYPGNPENEDLYKVHESRGSATKKVTALVPPTCTLNPGDLWCGVVTVVRDRRFYGYHGYGGVGYLSDDDFDVETNSYTIASINVVSDTTTEDDGNLTFELVERPNLTQQAELDELALYVGGAEFRISNKASGLRPGFLYWQDSGLDWSQERYVTLRLREASSAQRALEGRFVSAPARHDGTKRIKVQVAFSEPVAESPRNVGEHGVDVEGGEVTSVRPVGGNTPGGAGTPKGTRSVGARNVGQDDREVVWEFEIEPDSDGDVTVTLDAGRPCDEPGAICTADGRSLSEGISTTVEGPEEGPPPLTASFTGLPETHDGESGFTFRLAFSEPLSWMNGRRLREDVVAVSGGRATEASRVDRRRDLWHVTVEPDSGADVTVTLGAGAACRTPAAVCTSDGRALSETISATVAGPAVETAEAPLTASFENLPGEHDGESAFTLRMAFSEPLSWMNGRRLRENVVAVAGGRATAASRVDRRRDLWQVTVEPDSLADVTVTLEAGAACGTPAAVCTSDGRALSNTISTTVRGPVAVSVADARAEEGADETIDFAVSLSRAGSGTVAVAYATADGTATAGEDYTARKGELTFDPGETEKTVSVPVLDDAIDEGEETFTLRLTNASGARIADGEATGTIENSDPLQKMWLSRFGRTVAGQVVDAVTGRLSGPTGGSQVTLGGQSIDLSALSAGSADARRSLAGALGAAEDDDPLAGPGAWEAARAGSWDDPETGATVRSLTGRELLLGSSFHLAAGGGEAGGPGYAAWGRVAVGGFDAEAPAENGDVRLDGEVTTGVLGADAQWERWLAGVALSVSSAEGTFDQPGVDSGTVESSLTSVNPYVRYEASDRLSVWGLVGYGTGDMTMTQAANHNRGKIVTRTDISMRLGAAGARGVLLKAGADGGIDLALRGDAFLVQMESEAAANTVETKADASRLRLVLEAGRSFALGEGAVLAPGLEVGLRHDGGDAETGTGVEVGGRIRYTDAGSGLTVEANARTLIAHEDSGYEEWGAGGSVRLDPGASGRGLSLSLAPVWGTPSSGVERLWSARDAAGLVRDDDFEAERRLEGELGYGFGAFGERGVVTPYAGLGLAEAGDRTWRAGARWSLAPHLAMSLDGARRESANDDAPEHAAQFRLTLRW